MNKLLVFVCALSLSISTRAASTANTDIEIAPTATHVLGIDGDTISVVSGSTYSFTVDTPEDKGLVSTTPTAGLLLGQLKSKNADSIQIWHLRSGGPDGASRKDGTETADGDVLIVGGSNAGDPPTRTTSTKSYKIQLKKSAVGGRLQLDRPEITVNTTRDLTLYFTAGQRSPKATVEIQLPRGVQVTLDNTTVNVIGRGEVKLRDLGSQSIGRTGKNYSYSKVGDVQILTTVGQGTTVRFTDLDLRPANGPDLKLTISGVRITTPGALVFKASYTASEPEVLTSPGVGAEIATLNAVKTISDFERVLDRSLTYRETSDTYTTAKFKWSAPAGAAKVQLLQSLDEGKSWSAASTKMENSIATVSGLQRDKLYSFKLSVEDGEHKGFSNPAWFFTGKRDVKSMGAVGDGTTDDTDAINAAISEMAKLGGGTLRFTKGNYNVRTVHLKSHVYLYLDTDATIRAIRGGDEPEPTWFSDRKYRWGLSPTDRGPYENPENWLTKQDVGHTFFRNTMFFAEREDNIKIIGTGRITGNGNLATSDRVMEGTERGRRNDKMFTFKLCTNIEIGGLHREEDLWYDPDKDEPYYIAKDGSKDFNVGNMLHIDRGGHFVLLATGTDHIHVHNTYFGKNDTGNARDIYDFMACSEVDVINIYSKVSSDDIVKLGSDCSLGFTRPVRRYKVRNIIGDTNCNLFQIGSETADDIVDVHVDNIYVLGSNKAGFSISTNDGALVKDIHLNCGHTGKIHSRSKMFRTRAPFFISISNRGRVIGASVGRYAFNENGRERNELLCKDVDIGSVENIILNGIDIYEVYAGSSYGGRNVRWRPYDKSQNRATPIVAGYALPAPETVKGGLDFTLPNGRHTGYIKNIQFNDVHVLVKGGNPVSDCSQTPPELGVGQYNVNNLQVQPSYGLWARHASDLVVTNCTFNYEERDGRYALFLDDVKGARISNVKMVRAEGNAHVVGLKNSPNVIVENSLAYSDSWNVNPAVIHRIEHTEPNGAAAYP